MRGEEFVLPVMHQLLAQERMIEPSKVTIQVSNKGLKIIQNVPKRSTKHDHTSIGHHVVVSTSAGSSPTNQKTEQIKHLIPHESITTVVQEEDIVCCLLLIFNPVTKCPVHVHGYRCDSIETACALTESLQILIDRPENQKKFSEIEKRLALRSALITQKASASSSLLSSASLPGVKVPGGGHHHQHREQVAGKGMLPLSSPHRRSQGGSSSDGRSSTRTQGSDGTEDSNCFHIMKNMKQQAMHSSLLPSSSSSSQQQNLISSSSGGQRTCRKESFLNMSNAAMRHHRMELKHVTRESSRSADQELDDEEAEDLLQLQKEHLFESLAHELKVKLNPSAGPILLPPRDYDTISRGRGNLNGIEERKSTNQQIVGVLADIKRKKEQQQQKMKDRAAAAANQQVSSPVSGDQMNTAAGNKKTSLSSSCGSSGSGIVKQLQARSEVSSSGKSSGIGSDEALAIIHENVNRGSSNIVNNSSSNNKKRNGVNGGGRSARTSSEEDRRSRGSHHHASDLSKNRQVMNRSESLHRRGKCFPASDYDDDEGDLSDGNERRKKSRCPVMPHDDRQGFRDATRFLPPPPPPSHHQLNHDLAAFNLKTASASSSSRSSSSPESPSDDFSRSASGERIPPPIAPTSRSAVITMIRSGESSHHPDVAAQVKPSKQSAVQNHPIAQKSGKSMVAGGSGGTGPASASTTASKPKQYYFPDPSFNASSSPSKTSPSHPKPDSLEMKKTRDQSPVGNIYLNTLSPASAAAAAAASAASASTSKPQPGSGKMMPTSTSTAAGKNNTASSCTPSSSTTSDKQRIPHPFVQLNRVSVSSTTGYPSSGGLTSSSRHVILDTKNV